MSRLLYIVIVVIVMSDAVIAGVCHAIYHAFCSALHMLYQTNSWLLLSCTIWWTMKCAQNVWMWDRYIGDCLHTCAPSRCCLYRSSDQYCHFKYDADQASKHRQFSDNDYISPTTMHFLNFPSSNQRLSNQMCYSTYRTVATTSPVHLEKKWWTKQSPLYRHNPLHHIKPAEFLINRTGSYTQTQGRTAKRAWISTHLNVIVLRSFWCWQSAWVKIKRTLAWRDINTGSACWSSEINAVLIMRPWAVRS